MAAKTLPLMSAWVLGLTFALLGIPTASADTWDFISPPNPTGLLGTMQSYQSNPPSGFELTAAGFSGFSSPGQLPGAPNVNLFGKTGGGDENGLGLANDPTGDNEITGTSLIRIALGAGVIAPVSFIMGSTTGGEAWLVSGSNSATTGFVPLLTGNDELVPHGLPFFNFYTFQATIGNVLLSSITAAVVPGPVVGAGLPGLMVACGVLIALARRRRQRLA
jgi:hypothetical protein